MDVDADSEVEAYMHGYIEIVAQADVDVARSCPHYIWSLM